MGRLLEIAKAGSTGKALRPARALESDLGATNRPRIQQPAAKVTSPEVIAELREKSIEAKRKFGQSHASLFPFLGRKVRTPGGPGTLQQVFAERVTVLLDSELSKCAVFTPDEVMPCEWSD